MNKLLIKNFIKNNKIFLIVIATLIICSIGFMIATILVAQNETDQKNKYKKNIANYSSKNSVLSKKISKLEKDAKALQKRSKKMLTNLGSANEKKNAEQRTSFLSEISALVLERERLSREITSKEENIKAKEASIKSLSDEFDEYLEETALDTETKDNEINDLKSQKNDLIILKTDLEGKIVELERIKKFLLEKALIRRDVKIEELKQKIAQNKEIYELKDIFLLEDRKKLKANKKAIKKLETEKTDLVQKLKERDKTIEKLQDKKNDVAKEALERNNDHYQQLLIKKEKEVSKAKKEAEEAKKEANTERETAQTLQAEKYGFQNEQKKLEDELSNSQKKLQTQIKKASRLSTKVEKLEGDVSALEGEKALFEGSLKKKNDIIKQKNKEIEKYISDQIRLSNLENLIDDIKKLPESELRKKILSELE